MDKTIRSLAIAFAAFAVSFFFDRPIALFFASHRTVALNIFFTALTYVGSFIAILFLAVSFYFWYADRRNMIMPLWLGLGAAMAITYMLKFTVARARPFAELPILPLVGESPDTSFPSAHAAAAFSALPMMGRQFKSLKYAWIALALLIAFSRIYLGVHYLSDVIFGAVLGYAIGWLFANAKDSRWIREVDIFESKKWTR